MKRIIISLLLAVSAWLTATATNTVTMTSAQGHPGDEVEIAVQLANTEAVTALEIHVPLCDVLAYVSGSAVLNTERSDDHTLTAAEKDGKLKIVIHSLSLKAIKGNGGELCRFKLKLGKEPATYDLVPNVVISSPTGQSLTTSIQKGSVTLLSPKLEIITQEIDYGKVPIRSSYTKNLQIRNSGNEPLEITGIAFDRNDIKASPAICTIAAKSTQDIVVTYSPMQRGDITSNVTISSNAINPKAGKAVIMAQPFSVNELHVQRVEGVSDDEVTVVLKMNNMEPITGAQCHFELPEQLVYVDGSAKAGAVCVNTGHNVTASVQNGVLTLLLYSASNQAIPEGDGELITFRIRLNGNSGWYYLKPKEVVLSNSAMENMVSATFGEYVVVKSPSYSGVDKLDMGTGAVTNKLTAAYTITNHGEVDLVVNKVTFLAEGYAIEDNLPLTIAPWESKSLTVSYTPSEEGDHKTTMQIYTNDPTNRMFSVAVSNQVYEPNTINVSGENTAEGYRFDFGLDNYTDIVAVQMNIKWLPGMKTSMEQFIPADRIKNHSFLLTDLGNGMYQVLIYSLNNTPIVGTVGVLFTLDYTTQDGTEYRDTELKVTDIVLSDSKGNNYVSETDRSVTASFTNFVLRFVVEDKAISEQVIKAGTQIVAPEMEGRTGYTFEWDELPKVMPANDLTITGSYIVNKYKITYMVDGVVHATDSIAYGTAITAPNAPVKEGYTFGGWDGVPETMPAKDVTIMGTFVEIKKFTLEMELSEGWNWISTNLSGDQFGQTSSFIRDIETDVSRIVGFNSELVKDSKLGFVGQLNELSPTTCYQIYTTSDIEHSWKGETFDPTKTEIPLEKGWNWIGYIPTVELDLSAAFVNFTPEEGDVIKDYNDFATYEDGQWIGTLTSMRPGRGYMYYSGKEMAFCYPSNEVSATQKSKKNVNEGDKSFSNVPWNLVQHKYPNNMTMIAKTRYDNEEASTMLIGAFVGNECRGISKYVDGCWFITIYGKGNSVENVTFRAYDTINEREYRIMENCEFSSSLTGTLKTPFTLTVDNATGISNTLDRNEYHIALNSGEELLTIKGECSKIQSVSIVSSCGIEKNVISSYPSKGIDVSALSKGVYIVVIKTHDTTICKKFIKHVH